MKFLAELAEKDAVGMTREIYAEIRRLAGVPMVALIFRHLATVPGGLEWAWEAIGGSMSSGRLQEEAWRIAREAALDPIASIPGQALAALRVDAPGLAEIRGVAQAYNRANPPNLLSVLCLRRMLGGKPAEGVIEARAWNPPQPVKLVPMTDIMAMPVRVAALLDLVSSTDAMGARVVPSLYRHFGDRPEFLALLVTLLLQRMKDGTADASAALIRARMEDASAEIVRPMRASPVPDPRIAMALDRFVGIIPEMIVVGRLLEEALPPALE